MDIPPSDNYEYDKFRSLVEFLVDQKDRLAAFSWAEEIVTVTLFSGKTNFRGYMRGRTLSEVPCYTFRLENLSNSYVDIYLEKDNIFASVYNEGHCFDIDTSQNYLTGLYFSYRKRPSIEQSRKALRNANAILEDVKSQMLCKIDIEDVDLEWSL